jgi:hypothetical protein
MFAGVGPLTSVCRTGDNERERLLGGSVIRSARGREGATAVSNGFRGREGPVGTGMRRIGWPKSVSIHYRDST